MNDAKDRLLSKQITTLNEEMVALASRRSAVSEWQSSPGKTHSLEIIDSQEDLLLTELCRYQVARLYNKFFPS